MEKDLPAIVTNGGQPESEEKDEEKTVGILSTRAIVGTAIPLITIEEGQGGLVILLEAEEETSMLTEDTDVMECLTRIEAGAEVLREAEHQVVGGEEMKNEAEERKEEIGRNGIEQKSPLLMRLREDMRVLGKNLIWEEREMGVELVGDQRK